MISAGRSASGSRAASAALPREIGVMVAPWTTWRMSCRSRASRQSAGCVMSAVTIVSRSATGAK